MLEQTILSNLVYNEEYTRKVLPFIKDEYFSDQDEQFVFSKINEHVTTYNSLPTRETLLIAASESEKLNEERFKKVESVIKSLKHDEKTNLEWIVDKTEKFCQDKAVFNAVRKSILILDGKVKDLSKGSIPELLSSALAVSFDSNIGHDYTEDFLQRYDFYHNVENKIGFDLDYFNKITKGGFSRKSLNIFMAGTGVGKTLFMTHCAAANLMHGRNVLYISMEMAEEMIAQRIDANLLDWTIDELKLAPRESFITRLEKIKAKTHGKLIIKEYPTASAHSGHFRHLLNELKLKKNFVPDIIYIDYLNICASSRVKQGGSVNSYTYVKNIAEELRGLSVEFDVPIVSATQTNRTGYSNSDVDITEVSESFGLAATVDFMVAIVSSPDLEELGQIMVKQLKNRWGSVDTPKRFVVGIDRSKMRLFDLEEAAQENVAGGFTPSKPKRDDDKSVMDNTDFGEAMLEEEFKPKTRFNKKKGW